MQQGYRPRFAGGRGGLGLLGHAPAGYNPIKPPGGHFNRSPGPSTQQTLPSVPNPYLIQQGQFTTPPPGYNKEPPGSLAGTSMPPPMPTIGSNSYLGANNKSSMTNTGVQNAYASNMANMNSNAMIGNPSRMTPSANTMMSSPPPMPGLASPTQMASSMSSSMSGSAMNPDRDSQLALVSNLLKGLSSMSSNMNTTNLNTNMNSSIINPMVPPSPFSQPPPMLGPPNNMNNVANINNKNISNMGNINNISNNLNNLTNMASYSPTTPPPNSGLLGVPKQPLLSLPGSNPGPSSIGLLGHAPYDLQTQVHQPPPNYRPSAGLLATPSSANNNNCRSTYGNGNVGYHGNHDRSHSLDRMPSTRRHRHGSHDSRDSRDSRGSLDRPDLRSDLRFSSASSIFHKDTIATSSMMTGSLSVSSSNQDVLSIGINGQEEYDPAVPTGEMSPRNDYDTNDLLEAQVASRHSNNGILPTRSFHSGIKRPRSPSPGALQVTILGKARHVEQHTAQVKMDTPTSRGNNGFLQNMSSHADKPHYCHACSMDCLNAKGFEQHMSSALHQSRMQEMINIHMRKTDQQLARMKAEEHLRKIEGKAKEDYCRICDKRFPGTFVQHRRTQEHRRKERLTKRGCKLCDTGSYQQYPDYVKHIDSESHKKKKEELRRQEGQMDIDKTSSIEEDLESFPDSFLDSVPDTDSYQDVDSVHDSFPEDLEELVTVDATGIYEEERENEEEEKQDPENLAITVTTVTTNGTSSHETPVTNAQSSDNGAASPSSLKENEESHSNINRSIPLGVECVVPVSGYFCKLCHKFFSKESTAKVIHCSSPSHKLKYQKLLESKMEKSNGKMSSLQNLCSSMVSSNESTLFNLPHLAKHKQFHVQLKDIKDIIKTNDNHNNNNNILHFEADDNNGAIKGMNSASIKSAKRSILQARKRVAFSHKKRIIIIKKQADVDNETEVEIDNTEDQDSADDYSDLTSNNDSNDLVTHKGSEQDIYVDISSDKNANAEKTIVHRNKVRRIE